MKRFWLFVFDKTRPYGGLNDFYDSYDTIQDARQGIEKASELIGQGTWQIYDTMTDAKTEEDFVRWTN